MNETMTPEEKLEELCKDWESTYNNFSLEGMAYNTTIKRENEEIQKLVDNVFKPLTNNMIEVATRVSNFGDYSFNIIMHVKDDRTFSAQFSIPARNLTEERFIEGLFQKIWYTLGRGIVNGYTIDIRETAKLAGYIKLTEVETRQSGIFAALQEKASKRVKDSDRLTKLAGDYEKWRREILSLMNEVGVAWYESTEFLPGMKLMLENHRTGEITVKEIRSLSKKSASPLYRFTDGSYIPVNSDRLIRRGTWFANNDHYRKIGATLGETTAKAANQ